MSPEYFNESRRFRFCFINYALIEYFSLTVGKKIFYDTFWPFFLSWSGGFFSCKIRTICYPRPWISAGRINFNELSHFSRYVGKIVLNFINYYLGISWKQVKGFVHGNMKLHNEIFIFHNDESGISFFLWGRCFVRVIK